ncbi:MAG: phage holin family protein [Bacteroidetes bacterium]|nr:phage holin family protein [Bacteroidota bacterium]
MTDSSLPTILKAGILALIAFFAPIQALILSVVALIILDTITGVYKAWKLGEKITSFRFGNIISKVLLYNIAVISGFIVQKLFNIDAFHLAQIVAVAVALTELKSIAENVNAVTGIDVWQFVLGYLKRNKDDMSEVLKDGLDKKA